MSETPHYATAPEDRIPLGKKLIYGLGAFVNNILAAAIGGMAIVLNLGLGMNPALVGLLGALPRLIDAFTDPLMGYISDQTRSRWGRRRPYIFLGAILVSIAFALLWQLPEGKSEDYYFWIFLIGIPLFFIGRLLAESEPRFIKLMTTKFFLCPPHRNRKWWGGVNSYEP